MLLHKLINFSELSRYITGGDRNTIRINKIPKKWIPAIDRLILHELPEWWARIKAEINNSNNHE